MGGELGRVSRKLVAAIVNSIRHTERDISSHAVASRHHNILIASYSVRAFTCHDVQAHRTAWQRKNTQDISISYFYCLTAKKVSYKPVLIRVSNKCGGARIVRDEHRLARYQITKEHGNQLFLSTITP